MRRSTIPVRRRGALSMRRRTSRPAPRRHVRRRTKPRRLILASRKRRTRPSRRIGVRPARAKSPKQPSRRPPRRPPRPPFYIIERRPYGWRPPRTLIVRDGGGLPGNFIRLPNTLVLSARRRLRSLGFGRALWANRLRRAEQKLIDFINGFYHVEGFDRVVRLYFDGEYQRRTARMLIRLANRLADRNGRYAVNMRFYRTTTAAPDGRFETTVILVSRAVHYVPLPWSRLERSAVRRLMGRLVTRFDRPAQVRLLFERWRLPYGRSDLISRLRRMLDTPNQARRRWVDALPEIVALQ